MVLLLASLIIVIAVNSHQSFNNMRFPSYSYYEYINRSNNHVFSADAGAQLYEAESSSISGNGKITSNIGASNQLCVENLTNYSSMSYTIMSDDDCYVQFKISVNYMDDYSRPIDASNLFDLFINRENIPLNGITISASSSNYDFIENVLGTIHLNKGNNLIQIISKTPDYKIDYLLLTSPFQPSTNVQPIGHYYFPVYKQANKQKLEAENAERNNTIILDSTKASQGYYLLLSQNQDYVSFYINSDSLFTTAIAACIMPASSDQSFGFSLIVNDNLIGEYQFNEDISEYHEHSLDKIILQQGNNIITIKHLFGTFNFDYLSLNGDINYSPLDDTQRYEAENFDVISGKIIDEESASNNKSVEMTDKSSVKIEITSSTNDTSYLAIRIKNLSQNLALNNLFSIVVNGTNIDIKNIFIDNTSSYQDILIGNIELNKGSNYIEIESKLDKYFLDCLTLIKSLINQDIESMKFEGENALLTGKCSIEYNSAASEGKNIGYINKNSTITFVFCSEDQFVVNLRLFLSNQMNKNNFLINYLQITLNNQVIDLSNIIFIASNDWKTFMPNEIGEINIMKGINTLSITCLIDSSYNLDYIELYNHQA